MAKNSKSWGIRLANKAVAKDIDKALEILPNMTEENLQAFAIAFVKGALTLSYTPMRASLNKHAKTGDTLRMFENSYNKNRYSSASGVVSGSIGIGRSDPGAVTKEQRRTNKPGFMGDGPFYRALYQESGNGHKPGKFPDEYFEKTIKNTSRKRKQLVKDLFESYMVKGV